MAARQGRDAGTRGLDAQRNSPASRSEGTPGCSRADTPPESLTTLQATSQPSYRIAILDDPTREIRNPWSAGGTKPGNGWNRKLSFPFTGGANPGFRSGRNVVTSALQDLPLSLGFAVAFGTRNVLGTGNDDVVSAETLMMIKERFVEQYGVPRFTIGSGSSGAAIQQHLIAQNYPGMLDACSTGD